MRVINYPSIKGPHCNHCKDNVYFSFLEALKKPEEVEELRLSWPNSLKRLGS